MVQTPVRVKPPPALTGEIISPGCASFEMATPAERRADDGVLQRRPPHVDLALGNDNLLALIGYASPERVGLGLRRVEVRLSDQALIQKPALAVEVEPGLFVAHLQLGQRAPRGT